MWSLVKTSVVNECHQVLVKDSATRLELYANHLARCEADGRKHLEENTASVKRQEKVFIAAIIFVILAYIITMIRSRMKNKPA